MGRLFWKFFLSIWLAQAIGVVAISTSFWFKERERFGHVMQFDSGLHTEPEHDYRTEYRTEHRPEYRPEFWPGPESRPEWSGPPGPRHDKNHFPFMPMLLTMIASFASAALLAWHFARPIRILKHAFDAVTAGALDTRIGPSMGTRRDELADLGRDFDSMAQHLQALMAGQRRLLHDVSHEMRSPLARLQAAIGLARQRPERIDASLARIELESMRINTMIGELLTLSRLEAGVTDALDESVDIGHLLADIVDDANYEAEAAGKRVVLDEATALTTRGNAELLHSAIENVVRNAVKYTAVDTAVHIAVTQATNDGALHILVSDHGPGVLESELDMLFQPFFRGSHGDTARGHGLGLAIADRIVHIHQGTIRACNVDSGGLCVDIALPLHRA